jgi:protoporphyrinogen/coproporphyrinogen III oxidase
VTPAAHPTVAVLGGGITGLAAAWELAGGSGRPRRADRHEGAPHVVLLEASERFGGRIGTVRFAGLPVDTGADAFITRQPAAEALCRELGLCDELVAPATSEASVWVRGRLRRLPTGLVLGVPSDLPALARSGIVSPAGVVRAAADLVLPRRRHHGRHGAHEASRPAGGAPAGDPSVADVLGPRLGREVLERLVEPLVGGINAGSAARLSFAAVVPQLAAALDGHRSVVWALSRQRRASRPAGASEPAFLGLASGLGSLVERLVAGLEAAGGELHTGVRVDTVLAAGEGYRITSGEHSFEADALVVALPGPAAASALAGVAPAAAHELAGVNYASVSLVTLAWSASELPYRQSSGTGQHGLREGLGRRPQDPGGQNLPGSGFLVPRSEGLLMTACTFTSSKWPHSSVPGRVVVRASVGHAGDERALLLTDAELITRVREELALILGVTADPLASMVWRHENAFPQYETGHLARVERIRQALAGHPRVAVAGVTLDGIGIPACITSGRRAATAVATSLSGSAAATGQARAPGRTNG